MATARFCSESHGDDPRGPAFGFVALFGLLAAGACDGEPSGNESTTPSATSDDDSADTLQSDETGDGTDSGESGNAEAAGSSDADEGQDGHEGQDESASTEADAAGDDSSGESGEESGEESGDESSDDCENVDPVCRGKAIAPDVPVTCLDIVEARHQIFSGEKPVAALFDTMVTRLSAEGDYAGNVNYHAQEGALPSTLRYCGVELETLDDAGDRCTMHWYAENILQDDDEQVLVDVGPGRVTLGELGTFELGRSDDGALSFAFDHSSVADPWNQPLSLETDGAELGPIAWPEVVQLPAFMDLQEPAHGAALSTVDKIRWQSASGDHRLSLYIEVGWVEPGQDERWGRYAIECNLEDDGAFDLPSGWLDYFGASSNALVLMTRYDREELDFDGSRSALATARSIAFAGLAGR